MLKFRGQLQMASLSLYPQFETNLISNRKVIELILQLKSAKDHGKNYIKVKPHLVRPLLRNRLYSSFQSTESGFYSDPLLFFCFNDDRWEAAGCTWWSGHCYLNKGECDLNQWKDDSFVKRVAKNNNWNNADRHKIQENSWLIVLLLL